MHKFHPAQEGSRGEASHITNHPATNRDEQRLAIGSGTAERTSNLFHATKILCGLRIVEEMDGAAFGKPQSSPNRLSHGAPDFGRGNNVEA